MQRQSRRQSSDPTCASSPLKTEEQLDLQALHRVRERWIGRKVALTNQLRGFLLERGLPIRVGSEYLRKALPAILEDAENGLTARARTILSTLREEWTELETKIDTVTGEIGRISRSNEGCRRLMGVPGIGPIISTALVAAVGNATTFKKGRDMASWLGLVPRQHSSGGKTKLLGISKRGNFYIRKLMVEGARAAFARLNRSQHSFGPWMDNLQSGKHSNVAVVALANKMARIAWAVLTTGQRTVLPLRVVEMMQIAARFAHSTPHDEVSNPKFLPVLRAKRTDERTGQTGPLATRPQARHSMPSSLLGRIGRGLHHGQKRMLQQQAEYIAADQTLTIIFSLAIGWRTIHCPTGVPR